MCSSESCQVVARWPSGKTAVHEEGVMVGNGLWGEYSRGEAGVFVWRAAAL